MSPRLVKGFAMKSTLIALASIGSLLFAGNPLIIMAQDAAPLVVMNLAAHPDDEDGRTLTYYRNAKDAIAYSVIYTRGEGGQNEIGPELYEALGAIRSEETERAARILGTQTYFLNFKDFGYSKSAKETFDRWGGEDVVTSRLVYLIRKLKPDLMFTNHDTLTVGPRRQHGHHQVVGLSAYKAFDLAADPTYHPEQLEEDGVDLWQPQRLFLRLWRGRESGDPDVIVPVTATRKSDGLSHSRVATNALAEHASQGMGMFASFRRMDQDTYFTLLHSATDAPLDSTDLAANLAPNYKATPDPTYWIDSGRIPRPPEGFLTLDDDIAIPGQAVTLKVDANYFAEEDIRITLKGPVSTTIEVPAGGSFMESLTIDPSAIPTLPKVIRQYDRYVNHPPIIFSVHGASSGTLLTAGYLPLEIAPPLKVVTDKEVVRLTPGANAISVVATTFDDNATGAKLDLAISSDETRSVIYQKPFNVSFETSPEADIDLAFDLPSDFKEGDYTISITGLAESSARASEPSHNFIKGRTFSTRVAEGIRVGVIESYDNTLSQALSELGVDYVMLDSLTLASGGFSDLHTILVDIRAYLVRADLRAYNDDLLAWVNDGGHMVVNYQKMFEWNAQFRDPFDNAKNNPDEFAPFPLQLARDRVTLEDAPVTVLQPELPLFHFPNAISPALWDGWVQERGLYFPEEYADDYLELFEMNDPGENPLRSSTLLANYGSGTYMYTALGWYRQLKIYHPEVYAFFANLISLPLAERG